MLKSTDNPPAFIGRRQSALERLVPVVTPPLDQVHHFANWWFIDTTPRLTPPGGFELGARIIINPQSPAIVARLLRLESGENDQSAEPKPSPDGADGNG